MLRMFCFCIVARLYDWLGSSASFVLDRFLSERAFAKNLCFHRFISVLFVFFLSLLEINVCDFRRFCSGLNHWISTSRCPIRSICRLVNLLFRYYIRRTFVLLKKKENSGSRVVILFLDISVSIFDKDEMSKDDFIGRVNVSVQGLKEKFPPKPQWCARYWFWF